MGGNESLHVRLPPEIAEAIREESEEKGTTPQAIIVKMLGRRYKVKAPKPRRGRPKKAGGDLGKGG